MSHRMSKDNVQRSPFCESALNSHLRFIMSHLIPDSTKNVLKKVYSLIPARYRVNPRYSEIKAFIEYAQWWDTETIQNWQLQKLRQIVRYAYEHVPGYRVLYKECGIDPQQIQTLGDIKRLPFVTKEIIRDNVKEFTSRSIRKSDQIRVRTSGSTGTPFEFIQTRHDRSIENAFMHSGWQRVGWRPGNMSAVLRGKWVGSEANFWHYDSLNRELLLSSYYLTERTYKKYVAKLHEYDPSCLRAYPSMATAFADLVLLHKNVGSVQFKCIFLASENISDWQKEKIAEAFPQARLFGWYGHAEQAILAPMCEASYQYHVWPFYGIAEIVDGNGDEVSEGEIGEIVGTSLWSYGTPFIRYRTMDIGRKGAAGCNGCGRHFKLIEGIHGRVREILMSKTGRRLPAFGAANMNGELFCNVQQFQWYQDVPGKVVFKLMRKAKYSDKDTDNIRRELIKKLGDDMDLEIVFVDDIQKGPGGKRKLIDQRLEVYG